jgi:hypothetical protein
MGAPRSGHNALIYVSGNEIVGANSWNISISQAAIATPQVGDDYVRKVAGQYEWSGGINAWDQADAHTLWDAAKAGAAVALLIYPSRNTLTTYWSGSAIFSADSDGGTNAGVSENASFEGAGALTETGWA